MASWGASGGPGIGFLWLLAGLLLITILLVGVLYLLRTHTRSTDADTAMEILRKQYARGDLSAEEFENRSSRLSGSDDTV